MMLSSGLPPSQYYQCLGDPKENRHIQEENTRKDETKDSRQYGFKIHIIYVSWLIKSHRAELN